MPTNTNNKPIEVNKQFQREPQTPPTRGVALPAFDPSQILSKLENRANVIPLKVFIKNFFH